MAWFKVDDGFHASRKLLSIPRGMRLAAAGLWTIAGSWSAHQELDGFVPDFMVSEWGGTQKLVDALVWAGLWEVVDGGTRFTKWAEYQPTRADLESVRAREAERKRAYRARKSGDGPSGVPVGQTVGHQAESEHPDPTRPDPTPITSTPNGVAVPRKRGQRLPADWNPTTELIAEMRSEIPGFDLHAEHRVFVDYWISQPGQKGVKTDWAATWRNWMRRASKDTRGASGRVGAVAAAKTVADQLREMEAANVGI